MKYDVYTANPEGFLEGWADHLILKPAGKGCQSDWAYLTTVKIDIESVNLGMVRSTAVAILDRQIEERTEDFTEGVSRLRERKETLLAITHQPEETNDEEVL